MKKVFVSIALAAVALGSQAQIVKNDLLKGYKEGDVLEKTVYNDKRATCVGKPNFQTEKRGTYGLQKKDSSARVQDQP